jgi:uncharacterized membrane protein
MGVRAAITVNQPRAEVQRLWEERQPAPEGAVTFKDAPGDRGTEIHIDVEPPGRIGEAIQKVTGDEPVAKAKDALRRFKQQVETGEVARSEASPEGELVERKVKQRPAQPLDDAELEEVGIR